MRATLAGLVAISLSIALGGCGQPDDIDQLSQAAKDSKKIAVNVTLNTAVTDAILAELGTHGQVKRSFVELQAVTMTALEDELPAIRALPYVELATPDAERSAAPIDTVGVTNFANGYSTWDLDAINVTEPGQGRVTSYTGAGVYVAVIDTGLVDSWRQVFPEERIATEYAASFQGGGAREVGGVGMQPNKWEHDQNSHGTHVTSTIIGYSLGGAPINGVAPLAKVIPIKVLNQNGSGFSSMVAAGILWAAQLKAGPLAAHPVVINMSLGGPYLDAIEQKAMDYAISQGVLIVAAAGNEGTWGMGYPGAYAPVISVAAAGWTGEWVGTPYWWYAVDVADPTSAEQFYITDFSSRARPGQDLDVAAPGSWIVGPYKINSSNVPTYYYLGGTSMASPHVAGVVALMAEKNPALTNAQAEAILQNTALALPAGCRDVTGPSGLVETFCWENDAPGAGLVLADAALAATP